MIRDQILLGSQKAAAVELQVGKKNWTYIEILPWDVWFCIIYSAQVGVINYENAHENIKWMYEKLDFIFLVDCGRLELENSILLQFLSSLNDLSI